MKRICLIAEGRVFEPALLKGVFSIEGEKMYADLILESSNII